MASRHVAISVDAPTDRRTCVLAIEAAVKAISDLAGVDPAEGAMLLLIAAAHLATEGASGPLNIAIEHMAAELGEAMIEADNLFGLSRYGRH